MSAALEMEYNEDVDIVAVVVYMQWKRHLI